jgi:hypothetical protein
MKTTIAKAAASQPRKNATRKTYPQRLADLGLPESPVKSPAKQIRQFQLAHLAATLGTPSQGKISPNESAALALQFWNAAGKSLSIENQARVLTRGIFVFQRKEWEAHAKALIAYFDDCDGALPGQNDSEDATKCYCDAQKKAGRAVAEVWEGMSRHEMLKALFPGKNGTEKTREAEFVKLLQYAKAFVENDNSLDLQSDGENRLKASLVRAWYPLELMDEEKNLYGSGIKQIQVLLNKPEIASNNQFVAVNGQVVRWLAVMRQNQLSSNMKR